jgi:hypothetical protein
MPGNRLEATYYEPPVGLQNRNGFDITSCDGERSPDTVPGAGVAGGSALIEHG